MYVSGAKGEQGYEFKREGRGIGGRRKRRKENKRNGTCSTANRRKHFEYQSVKNDGYDADPGPQKRGEEGG